MQFKNVVYNVFHNVWKNFPDLCHTAHFYTVKWLI